MDLLTLRLLAGYSQARAAALAGVSVRTWRRWEKRTGNRLAARWLRLEAGHVPGWPPGWRARPDAIELPGGRVATLAEIEARAWVWELVHEDRRREAYRRHERALAAWPSAGRGAGA